MDHRLFAILAVACFALEGTGCAWFRKSKPTRQEEILMPPQTGSLLPHRIVIDREDVPAKPKKKKEPKRTSRKPPPEETEEADEEVPSAPDRFR